MNWTLKHQEFATKNNFWQSSTNIACYLSKEAKPNEATELELRREKFQRHIEKLTGQKYHRTTIRKALYDLAEKSQGMYLILEDYGRGVFKIMVFPLAWVTENKKPRRESSHNENARNYMFSKQHKIEEDKQQQQFIDKANELFKNIGLKFDRDALLKMWRSSGKSIERVVNAVKFLLHRNSTAANPIKNPHGLLIDSLRYGWAENFDLYYEPELPVFSSRMQIDKFVSNVARKIFPEQVGISSELYPKKTGLPAPS